MPVAGLLAELVFPGGVLIGSALLAAWGCNLAPLSRLDGIDSAVLFAFGVIAAYLLGLAAREVNLVPATELYYQRHLREKWFPETVLIADHLRTLEDATTRYRLPVAAESPKESISLAWTHEFVGLLRDNLLARASDSWGEYLMYQWNVARLARNSILPLLSVSAASVAVGIKRYDDGFVWPAWRFFLAAMMAIALAFVMRRTYRLRLLWHLEILLRTACSMVATGEWGNEAREQRRG